MAKEYKLSPERLKELQEELIYLKTVREKEVADQIKEARSFGDLSENSEYDEAKNEQGKLYSRIAEVENILANYVIIEEHEEDHDTVRLGSKLKVLSSEGRSPRGGRGLKCMIVLDSSGTPRSLPARGAWIEMITSSVQKS